MHRWSYAECENTALDQVKHVILLMTHFTTHALSPQPQDISFASLFEALNINLSLKQIPKKQQFCHLIKLIQVDLWITSFIQISQASYSSHSTTYHNRFIVLSYITCLSTRQVPKLIIQVKFWTYTDIVLPWNFFPNLNNFEYYIVGLQKKHNHQQKPMEHKLLISTITESCL